MLSDVPITNQDVVALEKRAQEENVAGSKKKRDEKNPRSDFPFGVEKLT